MSIILFHNKIFVMRTERWKNSMKNKVFIISIIFMLFLIMGFACASESIDISNSEDSTTKGYNVNSLSHDSKLESSNEVSVSQTNVVNSHNDNLGVYSDENNTLRQLTSTQSDDRQDIKDLSISSTDSVVAESSNDLVSAGVSNQSDILSASPVATKLSVSDAHYGNSATYFDVTLKDNEGNILSNQNITFTVNKKSYTAVTNSKGIASVKTDSLKVGSYTVAVTYRGAEGYSASSLSTTVKVLSSVVGSDLTKYYGYTSTYKMTFWKNNEVLANTQVSFTVNGKTYNKKTDANGVASIDIGLSSGKYAISAINPYSNEKISHKITVKKDKVVFNVKSKYYIHANKKGSFTIVLKSQHGVPLKNKKVSFTYNNKKVTAKTNANGKVSITIPVLAKGTYKISFKYDGGKDFYSASGSSKLVVSNPNAKLSSKTLVMKYNDGSKFNVKLTNSKGTSLPNRVVNLKINGQSLSAKTNSKGYAKFSIKDIVPGSYAVTYSHDSEGSLNYCYGSGRVIIQKVTVQVSASDVSMKSGETGYYKVTVKDSNGNLLNDVSVTTVIDNGKTNLYKTDSNGVAQLKITKGTGSYTIKTVVSDSRYGSATISNSLVVKGTKFLAQDTYVVDGTTAICYVNLVNEKNEGVSGKQVTFTFNGKTYSSTTDSKGVAKVSLGTLSKGNYKIEFSYGNTKGSSNIYVFKSVTLKELISASKTVKNYIVKNSKLPSTVKIGSVSFKTADYLYLLSKAIVNLKAGSKSSIPVKIIKNPSSAKSAIDLGYLDDYLSVAKKIISTAESKGQMPSSVSSKVGSIGYNGLVSAFTRIVDYYGSHNKLPNYISIESLSTTAKNSKTSISNLEAYLAATKNCQVNNAQIKSLVTKLTKNCKTDREKANAIFKYVRDTISYSFYYDTKYGAVGTLNSKRANCVDHSHLLAAMFRTAGLPTRYVHGTCTFSSGGVYGHVWTQVLIGNKWVVADATSSRNSLGVIANWNTHSYSLHGYYISLSF